MTYTSLSTKYQVVIPKEIRNRIPLKPGQKFIVLEKGGIIHLVPEIPIKKLRGFFQNRGINLDDLRDKSDKPA